MILDYLSGPNVITRTRYHDETGELEKDVRMEAEARGVKRLSCWLDDEGRRDHEPRNASSL